MQEALLWAIAAYALGGDQGDQGDQGCQQTVNPMSLDVLPIRRIIHSRPVLAPHTPV